MTAMDSVQVHPTDGPIQDWFELSYSNYQVLPRTLMQSMPTGWQERMVACLNELQDAFQHIDQADRYEVHAATEHILDEMTRSQMYAAGIDLEGDDDPSAKTVYHRLEDGVELDGSHRILLRTPDPVPHYNRGRTYIEPQIEGGASDGR